MSKSNFFGVGAITLVKDATVQVTFAGGYPSCLATAYATADSKPLPLLGLSSTNQGAKAGESVATVRVPAFWVRSRPGLQSWLPELPGAPVGCGEAGPDDALGLATTVAPPA